MKSNLVIYLSCKYKQFAIIVTGILILIGSLRCLKEEGNVHDTCLVYISK